LIATTKFYKIKVLKAIIASWATLNIGVKNAMLGDTIVSQTMLNTRTINATLEKIISSWIAPNKKTTNLILQQCKSKSHKHNEE
jgi:hypothetical protein